MRNTNNKLSCWVALALILLSVSRSTASECKILDARSSTERLLAFLRQSKELPHEKQDGECITFAIRQLEYNGSPEATELLIQYLDFERPLSGAERTGFMIHGSMDLGNMHPATGTLMTFGNEAVTPLLAAIKDANSRTVVQLATYTIMQIYREQPVMGIEYIKADTSRSKNSEAANLKEAARIAVRFCGDKYRKQCEDALR